MASTQSHVHIAALTTQLGIAYIPKPGISVGCDSSQSDCREPIYSDMSQRINRKPIGSSPLRKVVSSTTECTESNLKISSYVSREIHKELFSRPKTTAPQTFQGFTERFVWHDSTRAGPSNDPQRQSPAASLPSHPGRHPGTTTPKQVLGSPSSTIRRVSSSSSSSSSDNSDTKETVAPIASIKRRKPTMLEADATAMGVTPMILDASSLSDASTSPIASNIPAPQHRPVFRRLGSHRPPPSSPPEALSPGQLSMPTLPTLHTTSTPSLIEQYRQERRHHPTAFDTRTIEIKDSLIRAKLHRGGSVQLLNNEYTAELASRLDAESIERWCTIRRHEHDTFTESDDDNNDNNEDTHEEPTYHQPAPPKSRSEANIPDVPPIPARFRPPTQEKPSLDQPQPTKTQPPRQEEYIRLGAYTQPHSISGTIEATNSITRSLLDTGFERHIHETWIKVTQVVDLAGDAVGEKVGIGERMSGTSALEGVIGSLAEVCVREGRG